jgi:hypothetical protein
MSAVHDDMIGGRLVRGSRFRACSYLLIALLSLPRDCVLARQAAVIRAGCAGPAGSQGTRGKDRCSGPLIQRTEARLSSLSDLRIRCG